MKTITIPKRFGYPTLDVTVNGKVYTVKSGEEITIEDHIAEAIENAIALAPKIGVPRNILTQFAERSITDITGNDLQGVRFIAPYSFYNYDALQSIEIPNGVVSIGNSAFRYCKSLARVELPADVKSIDIRAFADCTSLANVILKAETPPSLIKEVFLNAPVNCVFEVPSKALTAYKTAAEWSAIANQIVAIKE